MGSRNVTLWVAGFAGVLLIYSAYKGTHPLAVISEATSGTMPNMPKMPAESVPTVAKPNGNVYDQHGNVVGTVPAAYADNPTAYVPPRGVA